MARVIGIAIVAVLVLLAAFWLGGSDQSEPGAVPSSATHAVAEVR